ncbi:hypothetical protein BDV96DRAFT_571729, partial [Lophiotrema nucula]
MQEVQIVTEQICSLSIFIRDPPLTSTYKKLSSSARTHRIANFVHRFSLGCGVVECIQLWGDENGPRLLSLQRRNYQSPGLWCCASPQRGPFRLIIFPARDRSALLWQSTVRWNYRRLHLRGERGRKKGTLETKRWALWPYQHISRPCFWPCVAARGDGNEAFNM